ncbi:MAG TPA: hypothetical protein VMM12_05495 [Longimicrobiales bacterium]|nr:hypothetical protein [Longimicrobiales bacterium]
MRSTILVIAAALGLAVAAPASAAVQGKPDRPPAEKQKEKQAQARGQGQERGPARAGAPGQAANRGQGQAANRGQGQGQARGQAARGQGGPPAQARGRRGGPAPDVATFNRDLVTRAAAVRGRRHGEGKRVVVQQEGSELRVVRADGQVLFSLDREDASRLGYWRVAVAPQARAEARPDRREGGGIFDRVRDDRAGDTGGSPAFCRSGEGHPVWGREWCVDKGFGLGNDGGLWGRVSDVDDVILRRPRTDRELDRGGLTDVLGDIVFGRLALQSLVLGADQPLTGRWIGESDGPRILRVRAGDLTVAELVDADRDDRVDVMLVNLGS